MGEPESPSFLSRHGVLIAVLIGSAIWWLLWLDQARKFWTWLFG